MSVNSERFEHFLIARRADGALVELKRSESELVMLAFDSRMKRLVELHVVNSPDAKDSGHRRSAKERALLATEVRAPSFTRILTVGEDDGLVYFTSSLNDGEWVEDYIARRGALPATTTLCLLLHLLEDLVELQPYHRLIARVSLSRSLLVTLEDTFLQLRVTDFGLAEREERSEGDLRRLCAEVCELLFLLLTGKVYQGQNPDSFPVLTGLPSGLRSTLRNTLADRSHAPALLDRLRDEVREAFSAMVSNLQVRNTRKHLVIKNTDMLPETHLMTLLLGQVPVADLLGVGLEVDESEGAQRHSFSLPVRSTQDGQLLTVHLLPPSRIVPRDQYEAVPHQMWRLDPQKHPNILRSLNVWESADCTFLTEERESGFPLSRLLAERIVLNPAEVLVLMKQVAAGLEQAAECGVANLDLHPSNIVLKVGKHGLMQSREFEKLMLKRGDSWPGFVVKLRPHATMLGLYEQLLADAPADRGNHHESLHSKDACRRSFVALAAYLLTGQGQIGRQIEFPETVPPSLADYLCKSLEAAKQFGASPSPEEFLTEFEKQMGGVGDADGFVARYRGASVPINEMECAGSVSDFDDDSAGPSGVTTSVAHLVKRPSQTQRLLSGPQPLNLARTNQAKKGVAGVILWSVVGLMLAIFVFTLFAGHGSAPAEVPVGDPVQREVRRAIIPTPEELEKHRKGQSGSNETAAPNPARIVEHAVSP